MTSEKVIEISGKKPERLLAMRAVYIGLTDCLSLPETDFYLGEIKILNHWEQYPKPRNKQEGKALIDTFVCENIEMLEGNIVLADDVKAIGFSPHTQFAMFHIPLSKAVALSEIQADLKDWRFEHLSWSKYRAIIEQVYESTLIEVLELENKLVNNWDKFYPWQFPTESELVEIVVQSTNHISTRMEWTVPKEMKIWEILQAVEAFEQGGIFIGEPMQVTIFMDGEIVYQSPKNLIGQ